MMLTGAPGYSQSSFLLYHISTPNEDNLDTGVCVSKSLQRADSFKTIGKPSLFIVYNRSSASRLY